MDLKDKLIELRTDARLTQEDLANELQISISSIKKYENEKNPRIPETYILKKYSNFFNVSIDYLIDDKIENKTSENININKILNLSDKAIDNLKKYKHDAIDLFIESEQISTINNLLSLYFKFSNLMNKAQQLNIEKCTIDEIAHSTNEIIEIYKSYCTDAPLITLYSTAIFNLEDIYLYALENAKEEREKEKEEEKFLLTELKEEFIEIYTTFEKAIKIVKLELIEQFSTFLNNTSI